MRGTSRSVGLSFLTKFSQAFLAAKMIGFPVYSLFNGSSLRNIGLAIGILNKLFCLSSLRPFFPPNGHVFNKVVENPVKEKEEKDE